MREMICIVCPNGCTLKVERSGDALSVSGNRCKRGEAFALAELTHPTRTLCTTVATAYPAAPVLPVRTDGEIPRERMADVMAALRAVKVDRPLRRGEPVIRNVLDLGVNVIATSDFLFFLQKEKEAKEKLV